MDLLIFTASLLLYITGRKWIGWVGLLALTTNLFGFGPYTSNTIVPHNIHDTGLLLALIIFSVEVLRGLSWIKGIGSFIIMLFLFLTVAAIVDYRHNNTSFEDIIKGCKQWLILLTYFPLSNLRSEDHHRIVKTVVMVTIAQCIIYFVQHFLGIELYQYEKITYMYGNQELERGAFPPLYATFVFLLLFAGASTRRHLGINYPVVTGILIMGTVLLSMTRSLIFGLLIGAALILGTKDRNRFMISALLAVGTLSFLLSNKSALRERAIDGLKDIKFAFTYNYKAIEAPETFSYRIFYFRERLDYIKKTPHKYVFGLGFIHESSLKSQIFDVIEISKDDTVIQLDTGDIAWAVLIMRLGLLGTVIYLLFFLAASYQFFKHRHNDLSLATLVYLIVNLLLFSFSGIAIANPYFWPFIFIVYHYQISNYPIVQRWKIKN